MEELRYRHEYKYPLTRGQMIVEEAKISVLADKDSHVGEKGYYNIRSLYFDDYDNRCFKENENGVDNREKYRIRIYNYSDARISLEVKKKVRGKCLKQSCQLTLAQCEKLIKGEIPDDIKDNQQVLHKLAYRMAVHLMKPAVIVDYDRTPYVYRLQDANVRVTFDTNITAIKEPEAFFDASAAGRAVMPVEQELMEVKFDDFLPDEVYSLLHLNGLQPSTFSKFYLCRKFTI